MPAGAGAPVNEESIVSWVIGVREEIKIKSAPARSQMWCAARLAADRRPPADLEAPTTVVTAFLLDGVASVFESVDPSTLFDVEGGLCCLHYKEEVLEGSPPWDKVGLVVEGVLVSTVGLLGLVLCSFRLVRNGDDEEQEEI